MNDEFRWYLIQSRVREKIAVAFSDALRENGIVPVLLKGIAIERFYPPDTPRPTTDIDFAVHPDQYKEAVELSKSAEFAKYGFDIHQGLRHLDNREWERVFERTIELQIGEKQLKVLGDEDLLRVAAIHWLTDGCERKERLRDIVYLTENRAKNFDWDYCLNANGPGRRRWVENVILLANKYEDLSIDGIPLELRPERIPKWLTTAVEKRWVDGVKFLPLETYLRDPIGFLKQLKRRFPPNPIMSTIALEGDFDDSGRFNYQLRYLFSRVLPSFSRVWSTLTGKRKY